MDDDDHRWDGYRRTAVWVRDSRGDWEVLIGPGAGDAPDGIVHLLTAADPHGVARSGTDNEAANAAANEVLSAEISAQGGSLRTARGRECDPITGEMLPGPFEPGFAVAGLGRAVALELGRRHDQEAIFEVEGDEVRLLACSGGRAEAYPRRWP